MRLRLLACSMIALAACQAKAPAPEAQTVAPAPEIVAEAPAAPSTQIYVNAEGVAAGGYDLVSFFKGAGAPGTTEFTSQHEGATYRFASAENKAEFDADPAKFLPGYGGYCAYGAAEGHKAPIDPTTGQVINGKLYFNYNKSVQDTFNKDQQGYLKKADANWEKIKDDPRPN